MTTANHTEGNEAHALDPHLAHHFDTPIQQYESSKLGMWIFLATEILLFGGLFCAYSVYRANHPEIFIYAHQFLDKTLGGINTLILIASSFTMAWAVRAAQLGEQRKLVPLLAITLLCGFGFLGIKAVEYEHKWKHGLLWGRQYHPGIEGIEHGREAPKAGVPGQAPAAGQSQGFTPGSTSGAASDATPSATPGEAPASAPGISPTSHAGAAAPSAAAADRPLLPQAAIGPTGLAEAAKADAGHAAAGDAPKNVQLFFSIYFLMTGLHGLHVVAGMSLIAWLLIRAMRREFGPAYFSPVDNVGLYWHLVDMIWIYLFPLLYLIH